MKDNTLITAVNDPDYRSAEYYFRRAPWKLEAQPGYLIDLMATCVDLSGAKYPTQFAGEKI